jgi:hypothetical protein
MNMTRIGMPELLILFCILAVGAIVVIWPAARICRRLGFSPWLGLVIILPLGNLILLWFVALAEWPRFPESNSASR